jgi:hypothetical protein
MARFMLQTVKHLKGQSALECKILSRGSLKGLHNVQSDFSKYLKGQPHKQSGFRQAEN